jgi:predicted transcriptional regulator
MRAADIMTTNVFTINSLATVAEAIALMQDKKVRSLMVEPSEDGTYGIVTETDIIYKVATKDVEPESVMIYQIMTKPCIVVNPDLDLKNVARLFAETGISRAPVIQKHLLGIISVTDLIMKSKFLQSASDSLSLKIQNTLLHNRVALDAQIEIDRECEAAWDVIEETQTY